MREGADLERFLEAGRRLDGPRRRRRAHLLQGQIAPTQPPIQNCEERIGRGESAAGWPPVLVVQPGRYGPARGSHGSEDLAADYALPAADRRPAGGGRTAWPRRSRDAGRPDFRSGSGARRAAPWLPDEDDALRRSNHLGAGGSGQIDARKELLGTGPGRNPRPEEGGGFDELASDGKAGRRPVGERPDPRSRSRTRLWCR